MFVTKFLKHMSLIETYSHSCKLKDNVEVESYIHSEES